MHRLVIASLCLAVPARAEHEHHHHHQQHDQAAGLLDEHRHGLGTSLGLILATYEAPLFVGDYQGINLAAWWMPGRFGGGISVPAYRLTRNGMAVDGLGDVMLHGHLRQPLTARWTGEVMLMASAPTGSEQQGLGMGHVMVMPEAGVRYTGTRVAYGARLGVGYMSGGAVAHAEHGQKMWPLVEPMNGVEGTFGAHGLLALAPSLAAGLQLRGALPIGDGDARLIGGMRTVWSAGPTQTTFTLEHDFVGYAFGVRGVVETAIHFP